MTKPLRKYRNFDVGDVVRLKSGPQMGAQGVVIRIWKHGSHQGIDKTGEVRTIYASYLVRFIDGVEQSIPRRHLTLISRSQTDEAKT